ncbi:MAG: hypothetical protein Q8P67_06160 [archaeon]|nr:hypothetical protein [archaeon]
MRKATLSLSSSSSSSSASSASSSSSSLEKESPSRNVSRLGGIECRRKKREDFGN